MLLIKNGLIHDAIQREPYIADILVDGGKIVKIEKDITCEAAEVYDASGLEVYPGFVEAHCHTGLHGYGIGFEARTTTRWAISWPAICAPSTPSNPAMKPSWKPVKPA